MDRERFGRALGKGARAAARTAWEAVDAATAPSPTPASRPRTASPTSPEVLPPRRSTSAPVSAVQTPRVTAPQFANAARAASAGIATPLRHASRALWLELTGSFFALFTLSFCVGAWRWRAGLASTVAAERYRFYFVCALAVVFAYFSVSSFVRAKRRPA